MMRRTTTIFRNDQWEVTTSGIVSQLCRAPHRLQIDAELLLATEIIGDRVFYDWPSYMVRRRWVEPELFFEALRAAIAEHSGRHDGDVDPDTLDASFETARRIAANRNDLQTLNASRARTNRPELAARGRWAFMSRPIASASSR
jgi:hypothetical protein